MPKFRSTASFGKRQEFGAIAELLRRGCDVYTRLVDDQGIDCIVRQGPDVFFDVQIKARSKESKAGKAGHFPLLNCSSARKNYVFIFFSGGVGQRGRYWVVPSLKIVQPGFATVLKSGQNRAKYRLILNRPKYADYTLTRSRRRSAPRRTLLRAPLAAVDPWRNINTGSKNRI
jgi:hypothetical protein